MIESFQTARPVIRGGAPPSLQKGECNEFASSSFFLDKLFCIILLKKWWDVSIQSFQNLLACLLYTGSRGGKRGMYPSILSLRGCKEGAHYLKQKKKWKKMKKKWKGNEEWKKDGINGDDRLNIWILFPILCVTISFFFKLRKIECSLKWIVRNFYFYLVKLKSLIFYLISSYSFHFFYQL